jgi:hypothetical protein
MSWLDSLQRALVMGALAMSGLGCASKDDATDEPPSSADGGSDGSGSAGRGGGTHTRTLEATVDCVAMMTAGPKTAGIGEFAFTWAPLKGGGEAHLAPYHREPEPKRCTVAFRGDSTFPVGKKLKVFYADHEALTFDAQFPVDTMMFAINYNGKEYLSREGSLQVDFSEAGKRSGTYDLYASADDGEVGHFTGRWDYCAYGVRRDCPYNVDGARGAKAKFTSALVYDAETEPNDCRVFVDEKTGGVEVDLEVSIWRGMSITQLYTAGCDLGLQSGVNANRFTFKTGGWKGPGKYGPFKSVKVREAQGGEPALFLPSLYWKTPLSFQDVKYYSTNFQFCFANEDRVNAASFAAYTQEDSVCEYEIRTDPGHVDISCSNVYHASPAIEQTYGRPELMSAPFSLSADCLVEYKK